MKECHIAKNRNTYAKRQREFEKRQRAEDKRTKREEKATRPAGELANTTFPGGDSGVIFRISADSLESDLSR